MEKSFVFNSVNGDRRYKAEDFREFFASFIGNGVFPNPSTNLQVIANSNMTITIKQGKAWINGAIYINTDDYIVPIVNADGVLNRIDRVVLRMDTAERKIYSYVKKGTFSSTPVAPTLQRDADAYELALADVKVDKGTISITQANITDLRQNKNYCGIVHGTVEQIDVTTLFNQYAAKLDEKEIEFEEEFKIWFETVKGQLSGDVAGNLAIQIEANKKKIEGVETNVKSQLEDMTKDISTNKQNIGTKLQQIDFDNFRKDYVVNNGFARTTGTNTIYNVNLNPTPTSYTDGFNITIIPHTDCGYNPKLNVNGLGVTTILKQDGSEIKAGEIKANKPLSLVRVGSNFFMKSSITKISLYQETDLSDVIYNVQFHKSNQPWDELIIYPDIYTKVSNYFYGSPEIEFREAYRYSIKLYINEKSIEIAQFSYAIIFRPILIKLSRSGENIDVTSIFFEHTSYGQNNTVLFNQEVAKYSDDITVALCANIVSNDAKVIINAKGKIKSVLCLKK